MLFESVTKIADEEGVKCYLESSKNVPNVQIYERMGFEMSRTMECRDGGDVCMVCLLPLSFSLPPSPDTHGCLLHLDPGSSSKLIYL